MKPELIINLIIYIISLALCIWYLAFPGAKNAANSLIENLFLSSFKTNLLLFASLIIAVAIIIGLLFWAGVFTEITGTKESGKTDNMLNKIIENILNVGEKIGKFIEPFFIDFLIFIAALITVLIISGTIYFLTKLEILPDTPTLVITTISLVLIMKILIIIFDFH